MISGSNHLSASPQTGPQGRRRLAAIGDWLRRHQRFIQGLQWGVVTVYALLLVLPAMIALPDSTARIWDDITVFAQFVFWGIWWPGVLISMLIFGRLWCGIFCPEGALTELASRHGLGKAIPRWIRWPGWPFTAFVLTTVYGQLISVYQYPQAALLILGGSTAAAVAVGFLYGRNHRVWCRYLCPVNGVFGLLSKLAPVHFRVDPTTWRQSKAQDGRTATVNCAPMVPIRTMESASPCHMCGRCAGFRNAIELETRHPDSEITTASARTATVWDSLLIITGLMGVATGAFLWSASPWFIAAKQKIAVWLAGQGVIWPLEQGLPWWLLTNYPQANDVLTLLDGAVLLGFIAAITGFMTLATGLPLAAAARLLGPGWQWQRFYHIVHGLIPMAACGVILGLSAQTVTLLRADGMRLLWVGEARMVALILAGAFSFHLIRKIATGYAPARYRTAIPLVGSLAIAAGAAPWVLLFWIW